MAKLKFDFAILPRSQSETQIIQATNLASFGIPRLSAEEPHDHFQVRKIYKRLRCSPELRREIPNEANLAA